MSQITPETTDINGSQYTMYMLPPMQSHNLLMSVVKMVGPGLGPILDTLPELAKKGKVDNILEMEIPANFFGKAVSTLFSEFDNRTVSQVIEAFKVVTEVDGKPLKNVFDLHFQGNLDAMYKWLFWGMKVQWGKSLSALVGGISGQGALMQKTQGLPSQTT